MNKQVRNSAKEVRNSAKEVGKDIGVAVTKWALTAAWQKFRGWIRRRRRSR